MGDTVVVIPTWNGAGHLGRCLSALVDQVPATDVVVVDNGSIDESADVVRDGFPGVHVERLASNHGFAGGVNAGIAVAMSRGATYVALLNDDAVVRPGWLAALRAAAEAGERRGVVTPKMLRADGLTIDSTGDWYSRWGLPFPRGRDETDTGQYDVAGEVFAGSGGASLYRVAMLDEVGTFDELFFAYYEDVDLSFRARLAGWTVWYEPAAVVHHDVGGTSGQYHGFTRFHSTKNYFYLYLKNMPRPLLRRYLPLFVLAQVLNVVHSVLLGHARVVPRAYAEVWRHRRALRAARRSVQASRVIGPGEVDAWLYRSLPPPAWRALGIRRKAT